MSPAAYAELLPTLIILVAIFSLVFCPVAGFALKRYGRPALWWVWGLSLIVVMATCAYKLSGLTRGISDWWSVAYYTWIAVALLGVPSGVAAYTLRHLVGTRSFVSACVLAWVASLAAAPFAILLIAAVDHLV